MTSAAQLPPKLQALLDSALFERQKEAAQQAEEEARKAGIEWDGFAAYARGELDPELVPFAALQKMPDWWRSDAASATVEIQLPGLSALFVLYSRGESGRWTREPGYGVGSDTDDNPAEMRSDLRAALLAAHDLAQKDNEDDQPEDDDDGSVPF